MFLMLGGYWVNAAWNNIQAFSSPALEKPNGVGGGGGGVRGKIQMD